MNNSLIQEEDIDIFENNTNPEFIPGGIVRINDGIIERENRIHHSNFFVENTKNIKKKTFESPSFEINKILEREIIEKQIKTILNSFNNECNEIHFKKGIYIYGSPGCGKTEFVMTILKDLDYDIIKYDTGDVRNKSLIESITNNNISNCNVLQQMKGITKKIAIVMDEIDGMNNGDKGGITSLIKLIRQKKTKKQKLESKTRNPIICIGNYYIDKKIKELMKVCNIFELKTPTTIQMNKLLDLYIPIKKENNIRQIILHYILRIKRFNRHMSILLESSQIHKNILL